jgi:hypothetical protein
MFRARLVGLREPQERQGLPERWPMPERQEPWPMQGPQERLDDPAQAQCPERVFLG